MHLLSWLRLQDIAYSSVLCSVAISLSTYIRRPPWCGHSSRASAPPPPRWSPSRCWSPASPEHRNIFIEYFSRVLILFCQFCQLKLPAYGFALPPRQYCLRELFSKHLLGERRKKVILLSVCLKTMMKTWTYLIWSSSAVTRFSMDFSSSISWSPENS